MDSNATLDKLQQISSVGSNWYQIATRALRSLEESEIFGLLGYFADNAPAYFHPNGFYKYSLHFGERDAFRLRLHIWPDDRQLLFQPIHNHSFDFVSRVLIGNFHHGFYRMGAAADEALDAHSYRREYRRSSDTYSLHKLSPKSVVQTSKELLTRGSVYIQKHDQLHTLDRVEPKLSATLLISCIEGIQQPATIFANHEKGQHVLNSPEFEIPALSSRERWYWVNRVRNHLRDQA